MHRRPRFVVDLDVPAQLRMRDQRLGRLHLPKPQHAAEPADVEPVRLHARLARAPHRDRRHEHHRVVLGEDRALLLGGRHAHQRLGALGVDLLDVDAERAECAVERDGGHRADLRVRDRHRRRIGPGRLRASAVVADDRHAIRARIARGLERRVRDDAAREERLAPHRCHERRRKRALRLMQPRRLARELHGFRRDLFGDHRVAGRDAEVGAFDADHLRLVALRVAALRFAVLRAVVFGFAFLLALVFASAARSTSTTSPAPLRNGFAGRLSSVAS